MKPETVSLLCRPGTHEPFRLATVTEANGRSQDVLVGVNSGERFLVRDGIPLLLDEAKVSGYNKQYQGFYNRFAGIYDGAMSLFALMVGGRKGQFRQQYLQELEVQDEARVLEVSIGTGTNRRYFPPNVNYFGLDISWGMLKKCQKNMNKWRREAELIFGNAEELPLIDEAFDAVLHVGGINAFNDPAKAIGEMIRVAKAGSKIVIVDETAKMMESVAWMPSVKKWLREHGERFSAPIQLLPEGMKDIQARDIAKGNLYCLSFIKP